MERGAPPRQAEEAGSPLTACTGSRGAGAVRVTLIRSPRLIALSSVPFGRIRRSATAWPRSAVPEKSPWPSLPDSAPPPAWNLGGVAGVRLPSPTCRLSRRATAECATRAPSPCGSDSGTCAGNGSARRRARARQWCPQHLARTCAPYASAATISATIARLTHNS